MQSEKKTFPVNAGEGGENESIVNKIDDDSMTPNNDSNPDYNSKVVFTTNESNTWRNVYNFNKIESEIPIDDDTPIKEAVFIKAKHGRVLLGYTQKHCFTDDGSSVHNFHHIKEDSEIMGMWGETIDNKLTITIVEDYKQPGVYKSNVHFFVYNNDRLVDSWEIKGDWRWFNQSSNGDIYGLLYADNYCETSLHRIHSDGQTEEILSIDVINKSTRKLSSVQKMNLEAEQIYPDKMYKDPDSEGCIYPDYIGNKIEFIESDEKELMALDVLMSLPNSQNIVRLFYDVKGGFSLCAIFHITDGEEVFYKSYMNDNEILVFYGVKSIEGRNHAYVCDVKKDSGIRFAEPTVVNFPYDFDKRSNKIVLMSQDRLLVVKSQKSIYELYFYERDFNLIYEAPKGEKVLGIFPFSNPNPPKP